MNLSYRNQKNAEILASHWKKPLNKPEWFTVSNLSDDNPEIFIYDVIGWPYNDIGDLVRTLADMKGKTPLARINSPGGDVFDGMALYNAFASHPGGVNVRIESLAASMASVVAMAGKKVEAYQNTMMMIHNSWTVVAGNAKELTNTATLLDKIDGNILDTYTGKTKLGKREMRQMMDDETWMTAKDMKDKGFIDSVIDSGKAAKAKFDLSIFANCPEDLRGEERELTERDAERILRDAGFSRHKAKAMLAGCLRGEDEAITAAQKTLSIIRGK
jgi:ATP-dependent protease ClpP protease subunit